MTLKLTAAACVILVASVVLGPGLSGAAAQESQWQKVLREQLREEKNCDVNYWTNVFAGEIAGQKQVSARAHCLDGRSFDAKREQEHLKFMLTECEPTFC